MIAHRPTIVAGLLLCVSAFGAAAQAPDPSLRLKCALIGGDLSEPAAILAYKKCQAAANAPVAPAPPIDARGCLPGLAHRRATPDDIVCVAPTRAAEIKLESLAAIARQAGPDRCQQGFVWREAVAHDHACVPPDQRKLAADENARALNGFAYAAATTQNLCAYLDPAKIAHDLGLAEAEAHSTNAGDCDVSFASSQALVEINLVAREKFGFGSSDPKATIINGLGEKAVFGAKTGSDGLLTQRLEVLLADTALTIQVTRASMPNVLWGAGEAGKILAAIAAREAAQP